MRAAIGYGRRSDTGGDTVAGGNAGREAAERAYFEARRVGIERLAQRVDDRRPVGLRRRARAVAQRISSSVSQHTACRSTQRVGDVGGNVETVETR